MKVSLHAIEQFQTRHAPQMDVPRAMAAIQAAVVERRHVCRAPTGGDVYECIPGGLRVIIKRDRGVDLVVTVLPATGAAAAIPEPEPETLPDLEAERGMLLDRIHTYLHQRERTGDRTARGILRQWGQIWGRG